MDSKVTLYTSLDVVFIPRRNFNPFFKSCFGMAQMTKMDLKVTYHSQLDVDVIPSINFSFF